MPNISRNVGGAVIIRDSLPPAWATISRNKGIAMEDQCRIERGRVRPVDNRISHVRAVILLCHFGELQQCLSSTMHLGRLGPAY